MNSFLLYEGPSLLDGKDIIVVATGFKHSSTNVKTGSLIQTYILVKDKHPLEVIKNSEDSTICGDCIHRKVNQGTCYVQVGRAPSVVWKAYQKGIYTKLPSYDLFKDKKVRIGSYGDPAAVPTAIWKTIISKCDSHTAYTHQWKTCDKDLKPYIMASVDSVTEAVEAQSIGFKTFRVKKAATDRVGRELVCPASAEKGKVLTCEKCMACSGRNNVVINIHGTIKKEYK